MLGMLARHHHQRHKADPPESGGTETPERLIVVGVALDAADNDLRESSIHQEVVQHRILRRGAVVGAVPHQEVSGIPILSQWYQHPIDQLSVILLVEEEWRRQADLPEVAPPPLHLLL